MRIQGVNIPEKKRLEIGLTAIYGVGRARAQDVLKNAGVPFEKKPGDLNPADTAKIRSEVEKFKIEGDLKREVGGNIKRLRDVKAYRGARHSRRLPSRGQRTKTNSRTVRGNVRRTMGSGKRKLEKK